MRLQVLNKEPSDWETNVQNLGGVIGHSTTYARYISAAQPNAKARYFRWLSDDEKVLGLSLGFETRSVHTVMAPITGRVWLATTPVVHNEVKSGLLSFLREVDAYARDSRAVEMDVGSWGSKRGTEELRELGFNLIRRLEFELALDRTEEELWDGMEYKRRKNIKKAIHCGVVLRDQSNEQGVAELRRLQGYSSERIVARGGTDITYSGDLFSDPVGILLNSGLARIICAEVDGKVVSAGLFTHFNGLVYHTLSGHSGAALETQAPTLLLWETIKRYRQEGARKFNFGGCKADAVNAGSSEHGVYVYKKAFGAECIECTSGHKVLRQVAYHLSHALRTVLGRR